LLIEQHPLEILYLNAILFPETVKALRSRRILIWLFVRPSDVQIHKLINSYNPAAAIELLNRSEVKL